MDGYLTRRPLHRRGVLLRQWGLILKHSPLCLCLPLLVSYHLQSCGKKKKIISVNAPRLGLDTSLRLVSSLGTPFSLSSPPKKILLVLSDCHLLLLLSTLFILLLRIPLQSLRNSSALKQTNPPSLPIGALGLAAPPPLSTSTTPATTCCWSAEPWLSLSACWAPLRLLCRFVETAVKARRVQKQRELLANSTT